MSRAYAVEYAPEALDDLKEIYAYIAFACSAPDTAEKLVNRIRDRVRSLNAMPSRYAAVDWEPWRSMGMRKAPVDRFVIYYTVDDNRDRVVVIRVFYGGRDIKAILDETLH